MKSRCLIAIILLAAATLVAPAAAQPIGGVTLDATPAAAEIARGGNVSIVVGITNEAPLGKRVTLNASDQNPVGWTHALDPTTVFVKSGARNTTTLTLFAPADAQAGTTVTLAFAAYDVDLHQTASAPLAINLTIVEPAAPVGSSEEPAAPRAPDLRLSVGASTADAGGPAFGTLRLVTSEPQLQISLGFAPHAWSPRFKDDITVYTLSRDAPRDIPIQAAIPSTAADGATQSFGITATADGYAYHATWRVTVRAPDAGAQQPASDAPAETPADEPAGASAPRITGAPGLTLVVIPGTLQIGPGESRDAIVQVTNTGGDAFIATLRANAGDGSWPVTFVPDATRVVPGGATVEMIMRVGAPSDVFAGGESEGTVTAVTDTGLARSAGFGIEIVPAQTPPDTTTAAEIEKPAADSGVPVDLATTTWIALGLGAVGAGALAIANRPLREKLLWGAMGLYTRLLQPDILGHPERERLYRLVEEQPGIHFHALQRELSWNTGTLTYHLRVLERHQFVVSRRDGNYRRFYIVGQAPRKELFDPEKPTGLRADVLEAIRTQPGISQSDLAMALGANKQTVNYHVKALERGGTIRIEKRGRDTFLYEEKPGIGPAGPAPRL